jgi:hypothetical protein
MPIFESGSFLAESRSHASPYACNLRVIIFVKSEVSFWDVMLCILAYNDILEEHVVSVIKAD